MDANIAAFLAEGNKPDDASPASSDSDTPNDGEGEAEGEGDADEAEGEGDADESTDDEEAEKPPFKVDGAKLAEAIEKKDLTALLAAMGPAAEEMLTSKAHATLRLQVKDLKKLQTEVTGGEAKLKDATIKLAEKYGDPITARKACAEGDVDTFIDMVEKWSGHDWSDVIKWVTNGIKGRTERLEARAKDAKKNDTQAQERVQQALEETRTWIQTSLSKSHGRFLKEVPGAIEMVLAELRAGHSKGIDSPAKAVPLVLKKLQEQHAQLGRYFEVKQKTKGKKTTTPATKVGNATEGQRKTRETTLEEDIAAFVKKERPR